MSSTTSSMRLNGSFDSNHSAKMANADRLSGTPALCDGTRLALKKAMRMVLLHEISEANLNGFAGRKMGNVRSNGRHERCDEWVSSCKVHRVWVDGGKDGIRLCRVHDVVNPISISGCPIQRVVRMMPLS